MENNYKLKDLSKINAINMIDLLHLMQRLVLLGIYVDDRFYEWVPYNYNHIFQSPIYQEKDKVKLKSVFKLILLFTPLEKEDKDLLLSFMLDKNGVEINHIEGLESAVIISDLMAEILVSIWVHPINVPNTNNKILTEFAKKELTLGNYIYLLANEGT